VGKIPDLSLDNNLILLLRVFRTPWEGKGFGKGLAEPLAWLGLEDFRGLVEAAQSFRQEDELAWKANMFLTAIIKNLSTR
jgi:hypothetical protein